MEQCIQQLHARTIHQIEKGALGVAASASSSSPLSRLSPTQIAALQCCVEQAVLGTLQRLKETPHDAIAREIAVQTEYFLLAVDSGRMTLPVGSSQLSPPLAVAVMGSDEACDAVTAHATAFVCNTLHMDPTSVLEHVASAVGVYMSACQPSEQAVDKHCFPMAEVLQRLRGDQAALACCSDLFECPLAAAGAGPVTPSPASAAAP